MSKNMARLLRYAIAYRDDWHPFGTDASTVSALYSLKGHGFIEINDKRQFRLTPAAGSR